jgi:hypothetical protein
MECGGFFYTPDKCGRQTRETGRQTRNAGFFVTPGQDGQTLNAGFFIHVTFDCIFSDVPFAKLDQVLLLIKNNMKGTIPAMLNEKDNQVFLNYLAGGQNQQIAKETEANAASNGPLNVAARNFVGVEEDADKASSIATTTVVQLPDAQSCLMMKDAAKDSLEITLNIMRAKEAYNALSETRITCDTKEHNLAMERNLDSMKRKAQDMAMDVFHKKQMMDLRAQEVEIEERMARVKAFAAGSAMPAASLSSSASTGLQAPPPCGIQPLPTAPKPPRANPYPPPEPDHPAQGKANVGMRAASPHAEAVLDILLKKCAVPTTLDELSVFFKTEGAAAEAVALLEKDLHALRHADYEKDMRHKLAAVEKEENELAEQAAGGETLMRVPTYKKEGAKSLRKKQRHYCHLMFWALCRIYMNEEQYEKVMGPDFKARFIDPAT